MPENGCNAFGIGNHLLFWPRLAALRCNLAEAIVLGFDANGTGIANIGHLVPDAFAGMVGLASGNNVKGAIPAKHELRKRPLNVWTAITDNPERRGIAWLLRGGVVAQHKPDLANFATATGLPARYFNNLQSRITQD